MIFNIDNTSPNVAVSTLSVVQNNHIFNQAGSTPIIYEINDPLVPINTGYSSGLNYAEFFVAGSLVGNRINKLNQNLTIAFNPLSSTNGVRDYADGWYEIALKITDKVGNKKQTNTIIGIDVSKPIMSLTKPINVISGNIPQNTIWVNNLTIEGISNDDPGTGVASVEFFIDQNLNPLSKTSPTVSNLSLPLTDRKLSTSFIYQSPAGNLIDDQYTFKIRSTDYASNITENIINVGIDTIKPDVSITTNTTASTPQGYSIFSRTVNCEVLISSSDPGYTGNNTGTGSGLLKQDIYIADLNNNLPKTPSLSTQFSKPLATTAVPTILPVNDVDINLTKRKIQFVTSDIATSTANASIINKNQKIIDGCLEINVSEIVEICLPQQTCLPKYTLSCKYSPSQQIDPSTGFIVNIPCI